MNTIPTSKDAVWSFQIRWDSYDKGTMGTKFSQWIGQKVCARQGGRGDVLGQRVHAGRVGAGTGSGGGADAFEVVSGSMLCALFTELTRLGRGSSGVVGAWDAGVSLDASFLELARLAIEPSCLYTV
jgi:hypothetical protein